MYRWSGEPCSALFLQPLFWCLRAKPLARPRVTVALFSEASRYSIPGFSLTVCCYSRLESMWLMEEKGITCTLCGAPHLFGQVFGLPLWQWLWRTRVSKWRSFLPLSSSGCTHSQLVRCKSRPLPFKTKKLHNGNPEWVKLCLCGDSYTGLLALKSNSCIEPR